MREGERERKVGGRERESSFSETTLNDFFLSAAVLCRVSAIPHLYSTQKSQRRKKQSFSR